jgi:predicted  nucleic acid-binding Zn-ribbon protein
MQEQLQVLWQLQQLELRKAQLLAEREKLSTDAVRLLWQEMSNLKQIMAKEDDQLKKHDYDNVQLEGQLEQIAEQFRQVDSLLYGGRVKNMKELEQLRTKQSLIRGDMEKLENRIYANMECGEQLQQKLAGEEQLLQLKRQEHSQKQEQFRRNCADYDVKLSELKQQCDQLISKVDPALFGQYVAIGHKRAQPVAKLVNGICSGCRLTVPVQQIDCNPAKLNFCENCGRMLLLD